MKEYIKFVMDNNDEGNKWSVSFVKNGGFILVGLHWDDKPHPTHEFKCTVEDFQKMASILVRL